jgi:aldose sugar dehydrogenase
MSKVLTSAIVGLLLASCGNSGPSIAAPAPPDATSVSAPVAVASPESSDYSSFVATTLARFNEPWAMAFLPDGRLLVTEKQGKLKLRAVDGAMLDIAGVPAVAYGGQGGFGDVVLHPKFADNGLIYLSYVEAGEGNTLGAVVVRAKLVITEAAGRLEEIQRIWVQSPKMTGRGHFGHRIAFAANGDLYISSGDRQHFDPAQDMSGNLGKIVRLKDDGSLPGDNPFADQGDIAAQIWSLGHRNPLGIAFDPQGQLWNIEMGPKGGDELNRVVRGANYGYPIVSNGDHYDGRDIPDHHTRPEFSAPAISWTPVISPGDFIFYSGDQFPAWRGNALAAGLSSKSLVRIEIDGESAREVERFDMGQRIREVEQGPDGAIYLLEDGAEARLLKLTPKG